MEENMDNPEMQPLKEDSRKWSKKSKDEDRIGQQDQESVCCSGTVWGIGLGLVIFIVVVLVLIS